MEKMYNLTVRELCSYLRISRNTAYKLVQSGEIRSFRVKSVYRIPIEAVCEYVEKNTFVLDTDK